MSEVQMCTTFRPCIKHDCPLSIVRKMPGCRSKITWTFNSWSKACPKLALLLFADLILHYIQGWSKMWPERALCVKACLESIIDHAWKSYSESSSTLSPRAWNAGGIGTIWVGYQQITSYPCKESTQQIPKNVKKRVLPPSWAPAATADVEDEEKADERAGRW